MLAISLGIIIFIDFTKEIKKTVANQRHSTNNNGTKNMLSPTGIVLWERINNVDSFIQNPSP